MVASVDDRDRAIVADRCSLAFEVDVCDIISIVAQIPAPGPCKTVSDIDRNAELTLVPCQVARQIELLRRLVQIWCRLRIDEHLSRYVSMLVHSVERRAQREREHHRYKSDRYNTEDWSESLRQPALDQKQQPDTAECDQGPQLEK